MQLALSRDIQASHSASILAYSAGIFIGGSGTPDESWVAKSGYKGKRTRKLNKIKEYKNLYLSRLKFINSSLFIEDKLSFDDTFVLEKNSNCSNNIDIIKDIKRISKKRSSSLIRKREYSTQSSNVSNRIILSEDEIKLRNSFLNETSISGP